MASALSYRVVRPTAVSQSTDMEHTGQPVRILLLHGYGSNREDLLQLSPFFPTCELIAPHAPVDLVADYPMPETAGLPGWLRPKAFAWYRFRFEPGSERWGEAEGSPEGDLAELLRPADPGEFRRALGLLVELARKVSQQPGKLVVGGFSQGAAMACALGLMHPDLVDGVLLLSGYLPPLNLLTAESGRPPRVGWPVFIGHGTDDPLIPFRHAEEVRAYLLEQGARVEWHADHCGHEITLRMITAVQKWVEDL